MRTMKHFNTARISRQLSVGMSTTQDINMRDDQHAMMLHTLRALRDQARDADSYHNDLDLIAYASQAASELAGAVQNEFLLRIAWQYPITQRAVADALGISVKWLRTLCGMERAA